LAEFSREGTRLLLRGPDENVRLADACGDLDDIAAVVGEKEGQWLLYGVVGGHWLKPVPLDVAAITALAQLDRKRWLVVGRKAGGGGYAAIYSPLEWECASLAVPPTRAFLAAAGSPDHKHAVAVGAGGVVLDVRDRQISSTAVEGQPDLTAASLDPLGRVWTAGAGRVWVFDGEDGWMRAWEHVSWRIPLVGILSEVGLVAVMTVDGAVAVSTSSGD
jgi:hypothetical protein